MAQVNAKVFGGSTKVLEASTVADLKEQMGLKNYTAKVNGEIVTDLEHELSDEDFVLFTENAKGA